MTDAWEQMLEHRSHCRLGTTKKERFLGISRAARLLLARQCKSKGKILTHRIRSISTSNLKTFLRICICRCRCISRVVTTSAYAAGKGTESKAHDYLIELTNGT